MSSFPPTRRVTVRLPEDLLEQIEKVQPSLDLVNDLHLPPEVIYFGGLSGKLRLLLAVGLREAKKTTPPRRSRKR